MHSDEKSVFSNILQITIWKKKFLYLNNLTELEDYMEYNKKENKKQKHKKG